MYLPPLIRLRQPPDDPGHRLCPVAEVAVAVSAVHTADHEASAVLGASAVLCAAMVLEV